MNADLSGLMALGVNAMDQASEIVRARLTGPTTAKGDRDMASDVDFRIERELRKLLAKKAPEIGFLGEEDGRTGNADVYWALDPVDGTANFIRDIPLCAVSLSLVQGNHAILGVIDLPFLGGRYTAERGGGAYRTGRRLHASRTQTLHDAVVAVGDYAVGDDAAERNRPRLGVTRRLAERAQRVRMLGAVAIDLVWVAEGKLDASITPVQQGVGHRGRRPDRQGSGSRGRGSGRSGTHGGIRRHHCVRGTVTERGPRPGPRNGA